jgi:hypothetical protein
MEFLEEGKDLMASFLREKRRLVKACCKVKRKKETVWMGSQGETRKSENPETL